MGYVLNNELIYIFCSSLFNDSDNEPKGFVGNLDDFTDSETDDDYEEDDEEEGDEEYVPFLITYILLF